MLSYGVLAELSEAESLESLEKAMTRRAQALGAPYWNAYLVSYSGNRETIAATRVGHPKLDEMEVCEGHIRRDPIIQKLRKLNPAPFMWDQALFEQAGAMDLFEIQKPYGYSTGMSSVIRVAQDRIMVVGMDSSEPLALSEGERLEKLAEFHLLTSYASEALVKFLMERVGMAQEPASARLTPREIEVLKWSHAGKTAWETSQLLGISESTVSKMVSSICRKMGVPNKVSAIACAVRTNILTS